MWRPGILTRAVHEGCWLLLEDIDCAPMDVISFLVPVLESRMLSIPGKETFKAAPGFQLFATQRYVLSVYLLCVVMVYILLAVKVQYCSEVTLMFRFT